MNTIPKFLIADDQVEVLDALRLLLKVEGFQSEAVTSPAAVIEAITTKEFDLVLMDLNYARDTTSGKEGLELIRRIREINPILPVVVMTAWSTVDLAVEAMRGGVGDFVQKPWENDRLLEVLKTQMMNGHKLLEAFRSREATEKARIHEAAEARKIQEHLLPQTIPQFSGFEITGIWQPALAVSGDYYDVMKFDEQRVGLCIADVTGKGMPAALLVANLQAVLKAFVNGTTLPEEICTSINRVIFTNITPGKFITFFYGVLDVATRNFRFTNAGHNPPIVVRADGSIHRLNDGGVMLGIFAQSAFAFGEIQLFSGDRMVMFTDGVTEIENLEGEDFGDARLVQFVTENAHLSAADLQAKIMQTINEFSSGKFNDDATLIVVAVG